MIYGCDTRTGIGAIHGRVSVRYMGEYQCDTRTGMPVDIVCFSN